MSGKNGPSISLTASQVIEAIQDGVIVTDLKGAILAVNRAFCAVTGYSRRDVIGKNPRMLHSGRHDRDFYGAMWRSILETGRWQGEIWNRRKGGDVYPEWLEISAVKDAQGRACRYLGVFRDITKPKRKEERLRELAQYDPLTGLPNRRLFHERLQRALARRPRGPRPAVLFLDVDHFKDVNDRWGHAAGDAFLRAVGARLRGCVRRTDTVARWGGDEFAVLLDPLIGRLDAERVARKILRVLHRPFTLSGRRITTSASIGARVAEGKETPNGLIRKADAAMYAVKERGRNDVRFWTPVIGGRRRARPARAAGMPGKRGTRAGPTPPSAPARRRAPGPGTALRARAP